MKHSQKRTFMDIEKMSSDEFKAFCRLGNKNHFTRIRKMPLQDLLFTMINRKGLTLYKIKAEDSEKVFFNLHQSLIFCDDDVSYVLLLRRQCSSSLLPHVS